MDQKHSPLGLSILSNESGLKPKQVQKIINELKTDPFNFPPTASEITNCLGYPNQNVSFLDQITTNQKHCQLIDNKSAYGPVFIFIPYGDGFLKLTEQNTNNIIKNIWIKTGDIVIISGDIRYYWKYKFKSENMQLISIGQESVTVEDIIYNTNMTTDQIEKFVSYTSTLHPADYENFMTKLNLMDGSDRSDYLCSLLDTELEDKQEEIYHSRHNEVLYQARESSHESRILLWECLLNKLRDKSIRHMIYETMFGLDVAKLSKLNKKDNAKVKQKTYNGFIKYIDQLDQPEFETFVDQLLDPATDYADVFNLII